jgi:hypothetical protein
VRRFNYNNNALTGLGSDNTGVTGYNNYYRSQMGVDSGFTLLKQLVLF